MWYYFLSSIYKKKTFYSLKELFKIKFEVNLNDIIKDKK